MKKICFLFLFISFFTDKLKSQFFGYLLIVTACSLPISCGFKNTEYLFLNSQSSSTSATVTTTTSSTTTTVAAVACNDLNLAELGVHAQVTGTVTAGKTVTYSRSAGSGSNSGNYEYFFDAARNPVSTGVYYLEYTISNINDSGTHWTDTGIAISSSDLQNSIAILADPSVPMIYVVKSTNGASNVAILNNTLNIRTHLPYTIGITFYTTTGQMRYQDSEGNSGIAETNANLISNATLLIAAIGGIQTTSDTVAATYNIKQNAFALTPPSSTTDICGNAL